MTHPISDKMQHEICVAVDEAFNGNVIGVVMGEHLIEKKVSITVAFEAKYERQWEKNWLKMLQAVKKFLPDYGDDTEKDMKMVISKAMGSYYVAHSHKF